LEGFGSVWKGLEGFGRFGRFGREHLRPNRSTFPIFAWKDPENLQNPPSGKAGVPAEIRTDTPRIGARNVVATTAIYVVLFYKRMKFRGQLNYSDFQ
jgi:hypothetical protein